jgi:hypothetical protein
MPTQVFREEKGEDTPPSRCFFGGEVVHWCTFRCRKRQIFVQLWVARHGCATCIQRGHLGNGVGEEMEIYFKMKGALESEYLSCIYANRRRYDVEDLEGSLRARFPVIYIRGKCVYERGREFLKGKNFKGALLIVSDSKHTMALAPELHLIGVDIPSEWEIGEGVEKQDPLLEDRDGMLRDYILRILEMEESHALEFCQNAEFRVVEEYGMRVAYFTSGEEVKTCCPLEVRPSVSRWYYGFQVTSSGKLAKYFYNRDRVKRVKG